LGVELYIVANGKMDIEDRGRESFDVI